MHAPLMAMSHGTVGGASTPMEQGLPSLEMTDDLRKFQSRERVGVAGIWRPWDGARRCIAMSYGCVKSN